MRRLIYWMSIGAVVKFNYGKWWHLYIEDFRVGSGLHDGIEETILNVVLWKFKSETLPQNVFKANSSKMQKIPFSHIKKWQNKNKNYLHKAI